MIKSDDIPQKWERKSNIFLSGGTALNIQKRIEFYKTFEDEYSASDYLYQLRHCDERQNFGTK